MEETKQVQNRPTLESLKIESERIRGEKQKGLFRWPEEYRQTILRTIQGKEYGIGEISRMTGISLSTISRWRNTTGTGGFSEVKVVDRTGAITVRLRSGADVVGLSTMEVEGWITREVI